MHLADIEVAEEDLPLQHQVNLLRLVQREVHLACDQPCPHAAAASWRLERLDHKRLACAYGDRVCAQPLELRAHALPVVDCDPAAV